MSTTPKNVGKRARGAEPGSSENSEEDDEHDELSPQILKNGDEKNRRREGEKRQPALQNRTGIAGEITKVINQINDLGACVPISHTDNLKSRINKVKTAITEYVTNGKVPTVYELLRCQNALTNELCEIITYISTDSTTDTTSVNRKMGIEASRLFIHALPKLRALATEMHVASGTINELYAKTSDTALNFANIVNADEQ